MDHSLAPLNNGVPRKAGLEEEILPKEPTPNLEKKETESVYLAVRTWSSYFGKLTYIYKKQKLI
jgi:hypothetical protein